MGGAVVTDPLLCQAPNDNNKCPADTDLKGVYVMNTDSDCNIFATCDAGTPLGISLNMQNEFKVADEVLCGLEVPEEVELFQCIGGPMVDAIVTDPKLCEAPNSANVCPDNSDLPGVFVMNTETQCNLDIPEPIECPDSGFLVNDPENCPLKCPDGTYLMNGTGMECPSDVIPTTAKLTVNKEIYGCDNFDVDDDEGDFVMNCSLPDDDPNWILCDDLVANNVEFADIVCNPLQENEFDIEVSDNDDVLINPPGQFEGSTEGTMIMDLEQGTYNVQEIKYGNSDNQLGDNPPTESNCINAFSFDDGGVFANNENAEQIIYTICFEYEDENGDDCSSIDLQEGDNKTCTVKNHISSTGAIPLPEQE